MDFLLKSIWIGSPNSRETGKISKFLVSKILLHLYPYRLPALFWMPKIYLVFSKVLI